MKIYSQRKLENKKLWLTVDEDVFSGLGLYKNYLNSVYKQNFEDEKEVAIGMLKACLEDKAFRAWIKDNQNGNRS